MSLNFRFLQWFSPNVRKKPNRLLTLETLFSCVICPSCLHCYFYKCHIYNYRIEEECISGMWDTVMDYSSFKSLLKDFWKNIKIRPHSSLIKRAVMETQTTCLFIPIVFALCSFFFMWMAADVTGPSMDTYECLLWQENCCTIFFLLTMSLVFKCGPMGRPATSE